MPTIVQDFPNRPLRFITYSAGGGRDLLAHLIADGIAGSVRQPVTIEHIGGSDAASAQYVASSAPDGYTLLVLGPSLWIGALLNKEVTYDPIEDFAPITLAVTQPNVLVVHPSVPANSVEELIALARARPGELKYACGLVGTSSQLSCALFTERAGVDIVGVTHEVGSSIKTPGSGVNDLLAGKESENPIGPSIEHVVAGTGDV